MALTLDDIDWQVLIGIARECGSEYQGEPSWRCLVHDIASGNLTVVNRPDKRVQAFQEKLRRPIREQRQQQSSAKFAAQMERARLRQERNCRAAGIPPRGAQEAPDEACRFGDAKEQPVPELACRVQLCFGIESK